MNFEAYTGKDLQNFLSMLNQCEKTGVTDIRFVREKLQGHIDNQALKWRAIIRSDKKISEKIAKTCPECGSPRWVKDADETGVIFLECKSCRFSVLVS